MRTLSSTGKLTCAERHNTGPEVPRMERHVDARERDCREAALEDDIPVALLLPDGGVVRGLDDLAQHFLDLLDAELLRQL